jgi:hypothetical protein
MFKRFTRWLADMADHCMQAFEDEPEAPSIEWLACQAHSIGDAIQFLRIDAFMCGVETYRLHFSVSNTQGEHGIPLSFNQTMLKSAISQRLRDFHYRITFRNCGQLNDLLGLDHNSFTVSPMDDGCYLVADPMGMAIVYELEAGDTTTVVEEIMHCVSVER